MDRARPRSGLLIAAAGLILAAAAPANTPRLRAMHWLAPGVDAARILTHEPSECLIVPQEPETAYRIEIGRAAFRTPLILGGQAARTGISCASCHRNGRTNRDFDFPGVSGAPGTADVTSSVFSAHRGDDIDDPRPIPDLGGLKSRLKVSQDAASPALRTFIGGLVTEEFDGPAPPSAVLDGLVAYVRALSPRDCDLTATPPIRVAGAIADVRRAIRAARSALARGDAATAVVMIQSARSRLGDIAERYAGPDLAPAQSAIRLAAGDLTADLQAVRQGAADADRRLATWQARSEVWATAVKRDEHQSLYRTANIRSGR